MKKNMGIIDRVIRFLLAVVVLVLFLTDRISGKAAFLLGVIAVIFFVTSLVGTCPAYLPFKISTQK